MDARRTRTLRAAVEAFVPPDARIDRVTALAVTAVDGLSPARRAELCLLLDLLAVPMRLPVASRAGALLLLADSPVAKLRSGFATLKRLALFLAYAEGAPGDENPTWTRIGYPGPRTDRAYQEALPVLATASDGAFLEADVVVIGSGAGGGVAAGTFARAGKRVVVLEAGGAYVAQQFSQRELDMSDLYLDGGLTSSKDVGVSILAGATLGGGTAINWCTSFRLPANVAGEWGSESGIAALGDELAPHYAALERELGIAPSPTHNANNAVILDGARALGLQAGAMPRNAGGCGAGCGYCGFGCAYGKKRSTARAFLPDVTARGGSIFARTTAEKVLLAGDRAQGVVAVQTIGGELRRFTIYADTIVCAAGTLRTPGLLARSGVRHPVLGKRLFLHPVAGVMAVFDTPIDAFEGPMQSAYSDAYFGAGTYGAKIEAAPAHPGLAALALPWTGNAAHARTMDESRYAATLIALTRDRDPGSIELDGEATIHYAVSPYDAEHLTTGLLGTFDLAFAAGAARVSSLHNRPIRITREAWNAARRSELEARIRKIGFAPNRQPIFSAHQMGTAPMGADPRSSVVDPLGRVWGYANLYVTDASIFPQASGVNPMLTIMAMARRIATGAAGAGNASASLADAGAVG